LPIAPALLPVRRRPAPLPALLLGPLASFHGDRRYPTPACVVGRPQRVVTGGIAQCSGRTGSDCPRARQWADRKGPDWHPVSPVLRRGRGGPRRRRMLAAGPVLRARQWPTVQGERLARGQLGAAGEA